MIADNKIELHIPSVMGYEKTAMECAASIAKKMGFTAPYLLAIENGEKHIPSIDFIREVAKALHIDYGSLRSKAALQGGTKPLQVLPDDEQEAIVSFYSICVKHNLSAKEGLKKVAKKLGDK